MHKVEDNQKSLRVADPFGSLYVNDNVELVVRVARSDSLVHIKAEEWTRHKTKRN